MLSVCWQPADSVAAFACSADGPATKSRNKNAQERIFAVMLKIVPPIYASNFMRRYEKIEWRSPNIAFEDDDRRIPSAAQCAATGVLMDSRVVLNREWMRSANRWLPVARLLILAENGRHNLRKICG